MIARVELTPWRKSTFSASDSNCVEVGWRKSTFSAEDANCVEVAHANEVVGVRDSKNTEGPVLAFAPASWSRLIEKHGDFARRLPTS